LYPEPYKILHDHEKRLRKWDRPVRREQETASAGPEIPGGK
jgi:hypothetical protein